MTVVADKERSLASREKLWQAHWLDCPVALDIEGLTGPIVVINVPFVVGSSEARWREIVLVRRDSAQDVLALVSKRLRHSGTKPPLHGNGVRKVRPTQWDDLVLDPCVVRLLQADYESFFQREAWFKKNHLAFRRGYLLYGPPGNGKTSAICAMLSRPGIIGHSIDLFREGLTDDDLTCLFQTAAWAAPAVIVLEDIDRFFDQKSENCPEAKVSLQHLLNCLDGATTQDGVIVVATANNPQVLDPAISAAGRFDRVVGFTNPAKDLGFVTFKSCARIWTRHPLVGARMHVKASRLPNFRRPTFSPVNLLLMKTARSVRRTSLRPSRRCANRSSAPIGKGKGLRVSNLRGDDQEASSSFNA